MTGFQLKEPDWSESLPYPGKAATLAWKLYLSFIYLYVMWRVSTDRKVP